jgi:hypothetical protein
MCPDPASMTDSGMHHSLIEAEYPTGPKCNSMGTSSQLLINEPNPGVRNEAISSSPVWVYRWHGHQNDVCRMIGLIDHRGFQQLARVMRPGVLDSLQAQRLVNWREHATRVCRVERWSSTGAGCDLSDVEIYPTRHWIKCLGINI